MAKRTILAAIQILCFLPASWNCVRGQSGPLEIISGKFVKYCQSVPREEIFIHTDREEYIAGEDLWFKVYLIDRQSNKPSTFSKLVYFEILNPENHPVVSKRIEVENGCGPGQVILPDTLSSGNYTLRAYTNWMKNSLPVNCYMKNIGVYNALNIKSFKAKPDSGNISPEETTGINIPVTAPGNFSLKISDNDPDNLELSVSADDSFLYSNGNICYMFVQTRGNINYTGSVRISGNSAVVFIPRHTLIPGINQITLFNSAGRPILDRFIYSPAIDNKDMNISISGNKRLRDHISIEIGIDEKPDPDFYPGSLSISVSPDAGSHYNTDIADYMIFGTEFGVLPDRIGNRLKNEIPREELDEFLSTLKSSWIDWNAILSEDVPAFTYRFERENHLVYGKLVNIESNIPNPDEFIFLSRPGKTASFQYAKTDKSGYFKFALPISEALQDIIIQPEKTDKSNKVRLESSFSEEYFQAGKSQVTVLQEVPQNISEWSANYQVRKIYGITSAGNPVSLERPVTVKRRFYGKPDIEVNMDNYIKLPVMQEVFFELVPGVFLKNKKSSYEFSIFDPIENRMNSRSPGLLIDGVVVNDALAIAGMNPEIVEKIDVVRESYLIGGYLFYGLINVITTKGDFSCISLPDYAVRLPYRIIDPVNSFISPDYSTLEKRQSSIPDFRNTLYWNPALIPDKEGKVKVGFWTSDYATDYIITIQGITGNGKFVSYRKEIKIEGTVSKVYLTP